MLTANADRALCALLGALKARGYAFVTPSPLTHARVLARAGRARARDLADVFGWNAPFERTLLEASLFDLMAEGQALAPRGEMFASRYRVALCADRLFLHSPFPTLAPESVFFGPDSYRFAALVHRTLRDVGAVRRLVDIGAGAGIGAIAAAAHCPRATLLLTDINANALRLARINAAAANLAVETVETSGLDGVDGPLDLVLANPPYLIDSSGRAYRDGGGKRGAGVTLAWTQAALARLAPRGRFVLYSASAIVGGKDLLAGELEALARAQDCALSYEELDPDVWGEELAQPAYGDVDRIALIAAVFVKARQAGA